jgi:hypothetical protein
VIADVMKRYGVKQLFSKAHTPQTQGAIERFNRTLKMKMRVLMQRLGSKKWHEWLPQLIENYNNSVHSTIGMKPVDAHFNNELSGKVKEKLESKAIVVKAAPELHLGDMVRIHMKSLQEYKKNKLAEVPTQWTPMDCRAYHSTKRSLLGRTISST